METSSHWENNAGLYGWIGLAAYVIAADIVLPQTLSSYADKMLDHQYMRYVAWGVGGVVAGHVFNLIPQKYDIIEHSANFVARKLGL